MLVYVYDRGATKRSDHQPLPGVWAGVGQRVVSRPQTVGRASVGLVCNRSRPR